MDFQNLSPQQFQKVFKLCDIMSLEDTYVASTLLQTYNWDVQKCVDQIVYTKEQQSKKQEHQILNDRQTSSQNEQQQENFNSQCIDEDPYMVHNNQQEQIDYQDFQYDYPENQFQIKKKKFEEISISEVPLLKTLSEPHQLIKPLEKDRLLANEYHKHRHRYQSNLLKRSQQLYERIVQSLPSQQSKLMYSANNKKIFKNKEFIVYLHKQYKSKINFPFGTFMLNLIRSYLDKKYLLVFILHENNNNNGQKVVEKILNQNQLASFVNKNCVSYGMFDNSDDYEIVQKYVALKDLPAFAIFKYNKKDKKQQFLASYPLLSNDTENCLEWMAKWVGVPLKRKIIPSKLEEKTNFSSISSILRQQNHQYEEMEKLYNMKRHESRLNKQKIKQKENKILEQRKFFESITEADLIPGKTIQIKFRMPLSGDSKMRVFDLEQKVQKMFDYVEAFYQGEFEEPYCQFDLTQTFPTLSLKDKKHLKIKEVFQESDRQNVIVKQI